jgi:hypothetical protein
MALGACFLLGMRGVSHAPAEARHHPPAKVRLAVLIVVDQLRGDYLTRWNHLFGDRGFRRMAREGTWYQNCYYPYASTVTAAGHASLATGTCPDVHGIIGNDWYDRASGISQVAALSLEERITPYTPPKDPKKKPAGSGSPRLLLAPTVADVLKERTKGKVVSLSLKDRSAVLPGGQRPDACYWMDSKTGQFVTSTYYRGKLHSWVEEYNRARPADRWLGGTWERLRDDLDYDLHTGPDDMDGESRGMKQGVVFPHAFTDKPGETYYESVANSPFGNTLLLELAKKAIIAERLGQRDFPDLLAISFSSNDLIGHCWGPDSHEVLDATLRTDRDLMDLLLFLDAHVGKGQYAVVLSADHGVCPTPEFARYSGKKELAMRIDPKSYLRWANTALEEKYGDSPTACVEGLTNHDFYLSRTWLRANRLDQSEVENFLAGKLREQPEVQAVYTRTALLAGIEKGDALGELVRRSFSPDRSGDVVVVLKPYCMFWSPFKLGTTHGTAHDYDRHVPLLVLGPGIRTGANQDPITPQTAASILAHFLGIPAPKNAEFPVPRHLFQLE